MSRSAAFLTTMCFFVAMQSVVLAKQRSELQAELDELLDNGPIARRTTVALKVVDLETGKVLYDRYGDRLFTPASNLKIYTSACALDTFGPKHCFPTYVSAKVSEKSGTIVGDLRIIGGGNAMLSSEDLESIADRVVKKWSVDKLQGEVVVDNSRYSDTRLGPGWMWDDQAYYYNMPVTPLMVDFNAVAIPGEFDSDGDPQRVAIKDPPTWIASQLREMLRARGVRVETSQGGLSSGVEQTTTLNGTELAETLRHFNHESENAVGEVLLHEIAIAGGFKRPSWSDGSKAITAWLHDTAGLEQGSFKLVDGSGLSRYNLISADSSVKLLACMRRHEHYETFLNSLPAYEVEMPDDSKQELVRAKPGGMSGVSTISGYVQTLDGRELVFSLLANGFIGSSRPVLELRRKVWRVLVGVGGATQR